MAAEIHNSAGPSAAAAPTNNAEATTVLTTLHTLLRAHVAAHPYPTLPYLHPYAPLAPSAWKGKARAGLPGPDAQAEALRRVREAVEGARGVLARGRAEDKERVRAARAMREVITHESALLPLATTLAGLPPASRPIASLAPLGPSELFDALGKRLGLQVFKEDSQFGLLRTSLTLAGERFVVDVDLEADAAEDSYGDADGDDDMATEPTRNGTPATQGATKPSTPIPVSERGKVKLVKLTASHVTPAGGTGKSDWIERVLRGLVARHLQLWNARGRVQVPSGPGSAGGEKALETSTRQLQLALSELKALDDLAAAQPAEGANIFEDLEQLAAGIERQCDAAEAARVFRDVEGCIYPSFRLLPGEADVRNPAFRIRPAQIGELVPTPPLPESPDASADGVAVEGTEGNAAGADSMAVDPVAQEGDKKMCEATWILECVDVHPVPPQGGSGIVVRRAWLDAAREGEEQENGDMWGASIKAEGLLYQSALEESSQGSSLPIFPLQATFVHNKPDSTPGPKGVQESESESTSATSRIAQHWTLAHPGPEGFVVGRLGLPETFTGFGRLVSVIRAQVVLNAVFLTVFAPSAMSANADGEDTEAEEGNALKDGGEEGDDVNMGSDDTLEDDLFGPPSAIPLTVTLTQHGIKISLILPATGASGDDSSIPVESAEVDTTLSLELRPASNAPYVTVEWHATPALDTAGSERIDAAIRSAGRDVVAVVREIVAGWPGWSGW